jgi:hypothetical protein
MRKLDSEEKEKDRGMPQEKIITDRSAGLNDLSPRVPEISATHDAFVVRTGCAKIRRSTDQY